MKLKLAFLSAFMFSFLAISGIVALFIADWKAMTVIAGLPAAMVLMFWTANTLTDWWIEE